MSAPLLSAHEVAAPVPASIVQQGQYSQQRDEHSLNNGQQVQAWSGVQKEESGSFLPPILLLPLTQLFALSTKNVLVLLRSPKALLTLLLLPLVMVAIIWIVQSRINSNSNVDHSGQDVTLQYQACK